MASCGKCGSELVGSGKFCATCGAPVERGELAPATVSAGGSTAPPAHGGYAPPSQVNPFAATASPSSPIANAVLGAGAESARKSAPPKSLSRPPGSAVEGSQVSPLAMSNAHGERGAFQEALELAAKDRKADTPMPAEPPKAPPPAPVKKKAAGTQMMANAPKTPGLKQEAATPPPAAKMPAPARTIAMGPNPAAAMQWGKPAPSSLARGEPQSALPPAPQPPASVVHAPVPQSLVGTPHSAAQSSGPYPPQPASHHQPPQPSQAYGQPSQPHSAPTPPAGPGGWGWAPQQQAAPGYPYAYVAGARVHVTWSNGQRYPATVSQVNGPQCLVIFPDGQQHWVEIQYLAPG